MKIFKMKKSKGFLRGMRKKGISIMQVAQKVGIEIYKMTEVINKVEKNQKNFKKSIDKGKKM